MFFLGFLWQTVLKLAEASSFPEIILLSDEDFATELRPAWANIVFVSSLSTRDSAGFLWTLLELFVILLSGDSSFLEMGMESFSKDFTP